jgi:hypothetical protein
MPTETASRWWWPLTRWWGIYGLIIFIGLIMRLIDAATSWYAEQTTPAIERRSTETPVGLPNQPSWTTPGRRIP